MRRRLLPSVLVLALLLPAAVARADDEEDAVARLERRVEMLLDVVSQLNAEIGALRERVARLEAQLEGREVARVRAEPAEPSPPVESPPVVVFPDVSGVYDLDAEASVKTILDAMLEGVEDETERADMRAAVEEDFKALAITLRMEGDGKFFVRVESGDEEHTARGTWERDASQETSPQRLVLTTTHEDGEETTSPERLIALWEVGRLTLREEGDEDVGFVMVFVRR